MTPSQPESWPAAAGAMPPSVIGAVQRLRLQAATAEVVRSFESAGVQGILLKGASTARWLYEEESTRAFVDSDLLVPPGGVATAQRVLDGLGFEPYIDERSMPKWWIEHAQGWLRRQDGAIIDLHRTLSGVEVDPERVWNTLSANVEQIVVGGVAVQTLTIPGRAFHLALHAAQHGGWSVKVEELRRALSLEDEMVWGTAAEIAGQLEAKGAFALGLRMVPEGRELAERLDLPAETSVDVALRARNAPPVALGFEQLARADGLGARFRIVSRKVAPPPTFMRAWSPFARRGPLALVLSYAWRPLWILGNAPRGFKAWWAARRSGGPYT